MIEEVKDVEPLNANLAAQRYGEKSSHGGRITPAEREGFNKASQDSADRLAALRKRLGMPDEIEKSSVPPVVTRSESLAAPAKSTVQNKS